jgi:hypothetical protein
LIKKDVKIKISDSIGEVSGLFYSPVAPKSVMVFAHGAGAGMKNKFMEAVSLALANRKIATLRFNFPYIENGKKIPDPKPVAITAVASAVHKASKLCPGLPVFGSGKSFGGRMTSNAASEELVPELKGIIFFGFPLHPPGKPSNERAEHLYKVSIPMLFLQGTRDALANMDLLKPVIRKIGKKAELFIIEGADHSFHIPKEFKLKDSEAMEIMCDEVERWIENLI